MEEVARVARRLRLGLLGPLLPFQARRNRSVATRPNAEERRAQNREAIARPLRGPRRGFSVSKKYPPAPARRLHRLPARSLFSAGQEEPRELQRDALRALRP